jgi:hypothetical protein
MFAQTLLMPLLSGMLAHLPNPGLHLTTPTQGSLPWVSAAALGARLHRDLGLVPEAQEGRNNGRPLVLAVVPIQAPYVLYTGPLAPLVRAEVATAQAFFTMAAAARREGVFLQVTSGFRTDQQQRELYNLYRRGHGPLAAKPGSSNHQSGHALDLETRLPRVRRWLQHHAFRYGFRRTVSSERWHYEYWGIAQPEVAGSLRP